MYTHIKGVQILISLLKQYNIRHIVLSPGTRNTALAGSIENDDFFICYSIVDERSAGYFALGISEALEVPVCVSCTAATATCNYLPAIKEAYERNIQLVALTADQNPYEMFHMEDQCIDQIDMFHGYVKCAVDVPKVQNEMDYWYCNRRMNEAFMALSHKGRGPVQINYHMSYDLKEISTYDIEMLPVTRKINLHNENIEYNKFEKILSEKKRILVVAGLDYDLSGKLRVELNQFISKHNCIVVSDTYANIYNKNPNIINPKGLGDSITREYIDLLEPDMILSFGNIYYSTIKYFIPTYSKKAEHWQIAIDGIANDGYHCLTNIFECRPEVFFEKINKYATGKNDGIYAAQWKQRMEQYIYPDLKFTNFSVIKDFCKIIPENSLLHTTVLDSIRISNYVEMAFNVKCFANIGADGIDGAVSTFLGQAEETKSLAFLLIGDLSFMYDMNAMLQHIPSNVRILVINNFAGAEFHKNFGLERIPTLNRHIAAGHNVKIEKCCINNQLKYMLATNKQELDEKLQLFIQESETPVLLEVFTDASTDAATLKAYWEINRIEPDRKIGKTKVFAKKIVKKVLKGKSIDKLRKIIDIVRS